MLNALLIKWLCRRLIKEYTKYKGHWGTTTIFSEKYSEGMQVSSSTNIDITNLFLPVNKDRITIRGREAIELGEALLMHGYQSQSHSQKNKRG